MSTVMMY